MNIRQTRDHRTAHAAWAAALLLALELLLPQSALAQQPAANVLRIDGVAMVERGGALKRFLALGEPLQEKDSISVAGDSHVMLEFRDQTRITLRPNTIFRLNTYSDFSPESMLFGLVKGGFRAVTGLIGKRNPSAMRVETANATIGIRGTEFDARLCDTDCVADERSAPAARAGNGAAGRIVEMSGTAVAAPAGVSGRLLVAGAAINERDAIITGPDSYAVVAFGDESRVVISANTVFIVEQFRFDRGRPAESAVVLRLADGQVRVLTGDIVKARPEAYRIETAMGRIDVRSGEAIARCTGPCATDVAGTRAEMLRLKDMAGRSAADANAQADKGKDPAPGALPQGATVSPPETTVLPDGLFVHSVTGEVVLSVGGQQFELKPSGTAALATPGGTPTFPGKPPSFVFDSRVPSPGQVRVDPPAGPAPAGVPGGLYVWVRDGAILLQTGKQIFDVTAGNAALATKQAVVILPAVPNFMRFDLTPLPTRASIGFVPAAFRAPDGTTGDKCK